MRKNLLNRALASTLILSILLVSLITGCSVGQHVSNTEHEIQSIASTGENKGELNIIAASGLEILGPNSSGAYEISIHTDGHGKLFFYDFENRTINWVTDQDKPTDDESNPGWIHDIMGGAIPMATDNNLFIVKLGSLPTEKFVGYDKFIIKADLDGSNRTIIEVQDRYAEFDTGAIACDGEDLYFIMNHYDESENFIGHSLCKTDFATGEIVEVAELGIFEKSFIIGSYNNGLILQKYNFNNNTSTIAIYDAASSSVADTDICWENGKCTMSVADSAIFMMCDETGVITYHNFETGVDGTIEADLNPDNVVGKYYIYDKIIDGMMRYCIDDYESGNTYYYCLNMSDLSVSKWEMKDIMICSDAGDSYFVLVGDHEQYTVRVSSNGDEYPTNEIIYDYALISKEDYWNGIANYSYFEDNVH